MTLEEMWERSLCDPAFFAAELLGVPLHQSQADWLINSVERENLLVTGNRWGKSFVSAVKAIWYALFRIRSRSYDHVDRYRVLIASISQDQANLVFARIEGLLARSDIGLLVAETARTPFPALTFGNGATIEARTTQQRGAYLLGNDYDLIIYDEAAFDPDGREVVEEVLSLRLADREGTLDLVSTPNGRNWFYQFMRDRNSVNSSFYFQSGDSRENPHVSESYLAEMVSILPEARVQQNIKGLFVDVGGQILSGRYVDQALEKGRERPIVDAVSDATCFLSGWDLARKVTATVGVTVALLPDDTIRIVALERLQLFDWSVVLHKIRERQSRFPGRLVIDGTGLGDVIAEQLKGYQPEVVLFTAATKAELLSHLELLHAQGRLSYDRFELPESDGKLWSLEDELRSARWDENNRCDGLMALALAVWPLCKRNDAPLLPFRFGSI